MGFLKDRGFYEIFPALHLFISMLLVCLFSAIFWKFWGIGPLWATGFVFVLGLGKEAVDKWVRKTGWDWTDVIMDGLGCLFGLLFSAGYYAL